MIGEWHGSGAEVPVPLPRGGGVGWASHRTELNSSSGSAERVEEHGGALPSGPEHLGVPLSSHQYVTPPV